MAAAGPSGAGCRTLLAVGGRAGADAGRSSLADGWGGGPGPDCRVRMAAEDSRPYLGLTTLVPRHVLQAPAQQISVLGGRTLGLPLNQDRCTFVSTAQAIPLQVDMGMALQRLRIAEKYGKNYFCLLQAVFVAGRCPLVRAARRPRLLTSSLARSTPHPLPPQPAQPACTLCLPLPPAHAHRTPLRWRSQLPLFLCAPPPRCGVHLSPSSVPQAHREKVQAAG